MVFFLGCGCGLFCLDFCFVIDLKNYIILSREKKLRKKEREKRGMLISYFNNHFGV